MRYFIILISFFAVLFAYADCAHADKFNPVIIYQGSIEDNSFNVSVHEGVKSFTEKTGLNCTEVVVGFGMDKYFDCVVKYADDGYSPIFALYGNHFSGLVDFVRRYPATRFIVLDTVYDEPNMFSFVLEEHEGSFLAGALAAMASKSKIIGFISVVDIPFLRRFWCGYVQGAKYVDPQITVLDGFIGSYDGAWFDGNATAALADDLMDQGADVIYQAAGGAGPAVLKAAAARGKLGIGVDVNQNGLYPGSVLTSMLKRTDKIILAALMLAKRGIWRDNFKRLGLEQEVVGISFDEHNKSLITSEMRLRIETIKKDIVLGSISVHDYTEDLKCPLP
ncbi:BMP family ABC transporter substrate-binding protein [Maridesulfovibrio hydrothermalis]|uniref:Basic membrane lipoprotein n=1 Tax=Maridesulfovibrio hydrothermalis AM13 = DSM 14728 TaxID=1121451 RepID=L0RIT5_9BACT|nr:BMP family ABC transporter substrate-binding protein [Maridesulfovibrio hydrothermalis]CCO25486.1 Basic membrane lipoprotein [Maridesulfovibrio hydrothermalis AM13 = DSM 14728]